MIVHEGGLSGTGIRLGIVAARFNETVVKGLLAGALDVARRSGIADDDLELAWVPGAFEIPVVAGALAASGRVDAVICLGAVIRGDTPHFDYVAGGAATGIAKVGHEAGIPVIFGVLTTEDVEQALARSEPAGGHNVGEEGAHTAVEMATLVRRYPPA